MPTVEIPDHGIAEFPDDMTPDEIKGVIQKKFYAEQSSLPPIPEIKAAPTIGGELSQGKIGSAAWLLGDKLSRALAPAQPASALQVHGESESSLLGSKEDPFPVSGKESQPVVALKQAGNVVNEFMHGATTMDGIAQLATGGVMALPEMIHGQSVRIAEADKTPAGSPERWRTGLSTALMVALPGIFKGAEVVRERFRPNSLRESLAPVLGEKPALTEAAILEPERPVAASEQIPALKAAEEALKRDEQAIDTGAARTGETAPVESGEQAVGATDGGITPETVAGDVTRSTNTAVDVPAAKAPPAQGTTESLGQSQSTEVEAIQFPEGRQASVVKSDANRLIEALKNQDEATITEIRDKYAGSEEGSPLETAKARLSNIANKALEEGRKPNEATQEIQIGQTQEQATGQEAAPQAQGNLTPEPISPGPGAASIEEPLASYELRKFGERFGDTEEIAPTIREETGNRFYEPIPNKVTAEQAVKIIDERGVDESIRLLKDEKNDVPHAVRSTIGQTLIKKLNEEYKSLVETDPVKAGAVLDKTVDLAEWQMEYGTRLGQGVQAFAMWNRLSPEGKLAAFKRTEKRAGKTGNPEVDAEVLRLANEADKAAEGMPKDEAQQKLNKYIAEQTGYAAKDLPIGIYYGNILSGINTQLVNTIDTGLNILHEVNNLALANPKAAAQIYAGLTRGLGEGKYDALVALKEGRRITSGKITEVPDLLEASRFGEKGGVPIREEGAFSRGAKKLSEAKIAYPLNAYKYVMRMMTASDTVMFRGAQEARSGLLAYRLAEATGVEKTKLRAEADKILGYDRIKEFEQQAKAEGYSGPKAEARVTELMIQSRPEELRSDAADFAGVATYNHEPRGMLGYFANGLGKASEKYPVLKLFVPFTRIVANVTNRGLDNTPWGFRRALAGYGDEKLTGEAKQIAITRATVGTAALVGIGALSTSGVITLHGAGPSDPDKKKQLQAAGWRPYSIQVGKEYFTYTYTPFGLGLSALANYMDANRYNELSQKDIMTRTIYSVSRIGSTVFNQSFLSGMSNLFEILSGSPGKTISSLKRFFSSAVTAATTPTLLRDINGAFDPTVRQSDNVAQDMVRNIPVVRLGLKPALNAYGEPVQPSRNRFFSAQKTDPAWQIVVEKNLRIPVADETIFKTPDDAYRYSQETGKRLKQYVTENLDYLKGRTDEEAQDDLRGFAQNMFESVRWEIKAGGAPVRERKRHK